jgi:DNA invertase Pin-like site-specific DNA recombinase
MSEKLKAHHLERGAYVYVRQSTPYQVRNNLESKERQYALEGRAQQLGFSKVVVIDEDLGRSGSGIQERPGFGRLLASVCQGLAGAVFALEASRLARNNRDGITWLICAHSRKRCSSIATASMTHDNLTTASSLA